ncbi:hypothetical protein MRX96_005312 [Rhipicephalus microplus]
MSFSPAAISSRVSLLATKTAAGLVWAPPLARASQGSRLPSGPVRIPLKDAGGGAVNVESVPARTQARDRGPPL